jgi:hypothetical protein
MNPYSGFSSGTGRLHDAVQCDLGNGNDRIAYFDPDSPLSEVQLVSGTEELKRRMEILLGAQPVAASDLSVENKARAEISALAERRRKIGESGGQLLTAALGFLGDVLSDAAVPPNPAATAALRESLAGCIEPGEDGRVRLTVTLPGAEAIDTLAATLARILGAAGR